MKFLTKFAGPLSFLIGAVLIKAYGTKVGIAIMIITIVLIIGASTLLRELTKIEKMKFRHTIKELVKDSSMYEFLLNNPTRLDELRTSSDDFRQSLYAELEPDDASRVKHLLEESQRARVKEERPS
jgi:hypothetical protein